MILRDWKGISFSIGVQNKRRRTSASGKEMKRFMKILFAASEALPFIASGGLADVAGALPKALQSKKAECRVILPLYNGIKQELREKLRYVTNFPVQLAWRSLYCGIFEAVVDGVKYYLVDNEYYFKRDGIYGFYDDAERYSFFSKAVLETIKHIDFKPDIVHCNDWQTALVPVYYNLYYKYVPGYEQIKTVFTIHNIQYQGKYGYETMTDVMDIPPSAKSILDYDGCANMMKGAIEVSDKVTTVSPTYAKEILNPWYAHGLDYLLRQKQYKLCGILNGIDNDAYNPQTDPLIYQNFSADDLPGKEENKRRLCEELHLTYEDGTPLIGIVTRLVGHKGLDLIKYVFEDIVNRGIKVVLLGSGEYFYESFFREMAHRHPGRVSVTIGFIPELARKIYASSDLFLMPSKSEPCGLAQMISLRYGTIPIVRETGGLKDSIQDCGSLHGNGFTFQSYDAQDMLWAITRAKDLYYDKPNWGNLVRYAMGYDCSWNKSADSYMGLYRELCGENEEG